MNVSKKLRIGIMGGTFDPIHNGHLVAASEVADLYGLDKVVFTPTGIPAHKINTQDQSVTLAEHRYLMTVIATAANPKFLVSRVDIERGNKTYTIDTLKDLSKFYSEAELYFITGADAINSIFNWVEVEKLFKYAKFIGVSRPGYVLKKDILNRVVKTGGADCVCFVEVPALAISSSDCRERAKNGRPIWYLVPDGVVQYITKNNLYQ